MMDEDIIRNMQSCLQKYNKILYSRIFWTIIDIDYDAWTHEHKIEELTLTFSLFSGEDQLACKLTTNNQEKQTLQYVIR